MKLVYSERFGRSFRKLSERIRRDFYKQAAYLIRNLNHPSLRAKKYDEILGLWQARVNRNARFYFLIEGDSYLLVDISRHRDFKLPKISRPASASTSKGW